MTASGTARRRRRVRAPGLRPATADVAVDRGTIRALSSPLPVGLLAWTVAADVIFLATLQPTWFDVAFVSGLGALVTGVIAEAVPSSGRPSEALSVGLRRVGLGLFALAAVAMAGGVPAPPFAAIAAVHVLGATALLGGTWLTRRSAFHTRLA